MVPRPIQPPLFLAQIEAFSGTCAVTEPPQVESMYWFKGCYIWEKSRSKNICPILTENKYILFNSAFDMYRRNTCFN